MNLDQPNFVIQIINHVLTTLNQDLVIAILKFKH